MKWLLDQKTDFVEKNYIKVIFHCISKKRWSKEKRKLKEKKKERMIDEENYI